MSDTEHPALIEYPAKAAFGRKIPKTKFYEHAAVSAKLKELFVTQVEQITWQYKLAPETINLPASPGVAEIQIFSIELKTPELDKDVLRCIDAAIAFPILFELVFDGKTQVVAAYKHLKGDLSTGRMATTDYVRSEWIPGEIPRTTFPVTLNLGSLYERLMLRLLRLPQRPKESLAELFDRLEKIRQLERDLHKAVSRLEMEKQFNRKVELNRDVRKLEDQLRQLRYAKLEEPATESEKLKKTEPMEITLSQIETASDLKSLNDLLTQAMQNQQHQALIKDEGLNKIVGLTLDLSSSSPDDEELFAAAILGRLAAVARGRESEVYSRATELFYAEPAAIDTLADGDEKEYAARFLGHTGEIWLSDYCAREALAIDTANKARMELLRILLNQCGSVADLLRRLAQRHEVLKSIESADTRIKRVRRIFESLLEVVRAYDGDVGQEPGSALYACVDALSRSAANADSEATHATLDAALGILVRVIELRFSHALQSETYQLLQDGKKLLSAGPWARFIEASSQIPKVQTNLLETALVLARQNRTDKEILKAMEASWPSIMVATNAVKRHFTNAVDIAPEVADYWIRLGRTPESGRNPEPPPLGNTEDQQIGELLIQLDANRDSMGKLNSAVVPVLKTFDAFQAATVERAATGYESIAQVAERLARMRKLSKTDDLGKIVEYNPILHDMEGGHRSGIRRVKVVRDGILKEFGGKIKTLVKPRVEAEE